MFRQIITIFRGAAHDAEQDFVDRNALTLLQQQMRDAAQAVEAARRAVAVAIAQNNKEKEQHDRLLECIADLEARTVAAIEKGEKDLAREAAESIALMEDERETSSEALARFRAEIIRLRANVSAAESKLRDLQRGQRIATATERTQALRRTVPGTGLSALDDAEETLTRLRERQAQIDLTSEALDAMNSEQNPAAMAEKLAEAGCGKPLNTTADDVLARLAKKAGKNV